MKKHLVYDSEELWFKEIILSTIRLAALPSDDQEEYIWDFAGILPQVVETLDTTIDQLNDFSLIKFGSLRILNHEEMDDVNSFCDFSGELEIDLSKCDDSVIESESIRLHSLLRERASNLLSKRGWDGEVSAKVFAKKRIDRSGQKLIDKDDD